MCDTIPPDDMPQSLTAAVRYFRFNHRLLTDAGRFLAGLRGVVGKRLTYRVLTAQGDAGFMGLT